MRGSPDTGTVRVSFPKLALLTAIRLSDGVVPGMSKFTWLKTLKISIRNCAFISRLERKFLKSPIFQLWNDGPYRKPLGTSPNVPMSFTVNAAGLNHSRGSEPDGGARGSPVSFARSRVLAR